MGNTRKIAIVVLGLIIGIVTYVYFKNRNTADYFDIQGDGQGAVRNESRNYNFLLSSGGVSYNLLTSFMPEKLPLAAEFKPWTVKSDSAFSADQRTQNATNARWLVEQFDSIVVDVAKSVKLPRCLIYALMLVETGSVAKRANYVKSAYDKLVIANTSGAIGPCQVKPITATETVQITLNKGFLTDYHVSVLQDSLGFVRANKIFNRVKPNSKYFQDNKIIAYSGPKSELADDNMNIMIAAMKVINLIDNYGEANLHQVFYSYNQGDRTALVRKLTSYTNTDTFLSHASGEGANYVIRMLGKHGAMDIVVNDLKIFM
jgi:hypothetical protein